MTNSKKLNYKIFVVVAFLVLSPVMLNQIGKADAQTQTVQGTLSFSPVKTKHGEQFQITLTGAPINATTRIWVDNNDGLGYQGFGEWVTTSATGGISVSRTLNCDAYLTLTPDRSVPIGNRELVQTVYLEYVGLNIVSKTATHIKDCTSRSRPVNPPSTPPQNPQVGPTIPTSGGSTLPKASATITPGQFLGTRYFIHLPKSKKEQAVLCGDTNRSACNGLPHYQYPNPPLRFVGRYLDAARVGAIQQPWRTLYADTFFLTNPIKNRVYTVLGSTFVSYDLSTFFTKTLAGPLKIFRTYGTQAQEGYLPWLTYFYPEENRKSGWNTPIHDGLDRMTGFDYDDRGYIYLTTGGNFGWGIVRDNGSTISPVSQISGTNLLRTGTDANGNYIYKDVSGETKYQNGSNLIIKAQTIGDDNASNGDSVVSFRSGEKYYIIITNSGGNFSNIFDVTNPLDVKLVRQESFVWLDSAKIKDSSGDDIVALVVDEGRDRSKLSIYRSADLAAGRAPASEFSVPAFPDNGTNFVGYSSIATDNINFYAIGHNLETTERVRGHVKVTLSVFSPAGTGTYSESIIDMPNPGFAERALAGGGDRIKEVGDFSPYRSGATSKALAYANGLLAVAGRENLSRGLEGRIVPDIKIFKLGLDKESIEEINVDKFFGRYYSIPPSGYAQIGTYAGLSQSLVNLTMVSQSGKTYLVVGAYGLGDVYEITGGTADSTDGPGGSGPGIPAGLVGTLTERYDQCEEIYASDTGLVSLCKQIEFVRQRTCSVVPGLPFCSGVER